MLGSIFVKNLIQNILKMLELKKNFYFFKWLRKKSIISFRSLAQ